MQFDKHCPSGPRDRLRHRLRLEALEDRLTPSPLGLFDVDGTADIEPGPSQLDLPQLQIVKSVTDGIDVLRPGDTASFTIAVTNSGPGPALNVLVTDQLPAAETLTWVVSSSLFDTTSVSAGDFLTASYSSLPAHATVLVTVQAVIPLDVFGQPPGGSGDLPGGPFELDGDATTGVLGAAGSPTPSHDWDRVYLDVVNRTSTSGAIAGGFVTDGVKSPRDDVFTGRSRDTLGIQAGPWRFQESKPQASDDISHAYAATYVDPHTGHVLLYAGLDRYDNSGDATVGFWFFRNPIGGDAAVTAVGGHPFAGQHADGDILLVSDFTQRGGPSALRVFRWTGDDSTGSLVPLTAPEGATFAIVNDTPITVPWSFRDKGHNSGPAVGEFLEAGVDLTALGLDGCFTSFLAETRSSQSPTATLLDFVSGPFDSCRLELPNTATVQADGIDPIRSNFVQISVLHEDAALGANLEGAAPAAVTPADSLTGGGSQPARGPLRGSNLPTWLTDVPAELSPWHRVTPDAASTATRDDKEPAALPAAGVAPVFDGVVEETGLPRGKGSDRDAGRPDVMADLWEPTWGPLAPLEL